jgi:hypothetical protein
MSFWRRFGGNPFWSFGLPFTVMVLGGMYVLTEIRSERYSVHSKFGDNRRIKGHELNSLEQDVEVFPLLRLETF